MCACVLVCVRFVFFWKCMWDTLLHSRFQWVVASVRHCCWSFCSWLEKRRGIILISCSRLLAHINCVVCYLCIEDVCVWVCSLWVRMNKLNWSRVESRLEHIFTVDKREWCEFILCNRATSINWIKCDAHSVYSGHAFPIWRRDRDSRWTYSTPVMRFCFPSFREQHTGIACHSQLSCEYYQRLSHSFKVRLYFD